MRAPIDDTIWASSYGSVAAVRAAFDRFGPEYHEAILRSGVPQRVGALVAPRLAATARGIDFGCGSGVLGLGLLAAGWAGPLDGIDLSPRMLELARATGCYRDLRPANLLEEAWPVEPGGCDFAVSVGLVGDYVPYYLALPRMAACLRPGGLLAFAVEQRSTPHLALERAMRGEGLEVVAEESLPVPGGKLEGQTYQFYVTHRA